MTIRGRQRFLTTALVALIAVVAGAAQAITIDGPARLLAEGDEGAELPAYVDSTIAEPEEMSDVPGGVAVEPACIDPYEFIAGQGVSCMTSSGLWKILLEDGSFILSHGGDPRLDGETDDPLPELEGALALPGDVNAAGSNMPECWADGNYRFRAVYAYQLSGGSTYSTDAPTIRTRVNETNYHFDTRAHGTSFHHELRFRCDSSTKITVSNAGSVSCADAASCTFAAITNKVKGLSWGADTKTYYVIFWKGPYSYCGQGGIENDDSDSANNLNNGGAQYSVVDNGCWTVNTILHEMTHNMGGVQHGAPEASGGWHCNDGYDTMCYNDGGSTSNYRTTACTSATPKTYDCNRNTYCDNKVTAGEWLDTHWNICDLYNRFATKTSF